MSLREGRGHWPRGWLRGWLRGRLSRRSRDYGCIPPSRGRLYRVTAENRCHTFCLNPQSRRVPLSSIERRCWRSLALEDRGLEFLSRFFKRTAFVERPPQMAVSLRIVALVKKRSLKLV